MIESTQNSSEISKNTVDMEQEKKILEPFTYLTRQPGKQFRPKLSLAFNHWFNIPKEKLELIQKFMEDLHVTSLLLDDIQDNSNLRRGVPSAHCIYGVASTINAANYVQYLTLQTIITEFQNFEVVRVFTEQAVEAYKGQGMEIYWRDHFVCPTETEYRQMVVRKTGSGFVFGVRLLQLITEKQETKREEYVALARAIGMYFQIQDDYVNMCSEEYMLKKGYCEDISEGKFSFPIVHAINSHPEDNELMNILRSKPQDVETKKYYASLLEKYGSFEYTRNVLMELKQEITGTIEKLGNNPYLIEILGPFFNLS